jgi:phage regulator Rha-like protein
MESGELFKAKPFEDFLFFSCLMHAKCKFVPYIYWRNNYMARKITQIQKLIYEIRGRQVMLDADLAGIYQVETRRLNEAVKRNMDRFPHEFMFQLTQTEYANLMSQFATSSWGGRRKLPFAFTEHGVIMLSSVLSSKVATKINIAIVKAFIEMRRYFAKPVRTKLEDLEKVLMLHIDDTDHNFAEQAAIINKIINSLNNLIAHPPKTKRIGFNADN